MKKQKKVPKTVELDTALVSYLDSVMENGDRMNMTRLSKEIELKSGHPHMNTVRNKLDEAFKFRDVLNDFKEHRRDGILVEVEKIEKNEVTMERLLDIIIKIKEEIIKIKEEQININKKIGKDA